MTRRPILFAFSAIVAAAAAAAAHADDADKVSALIAQSRLALGGDAVAQHAVLEIKEAVVSSGLSGTGVSWREIDGPRFSETVELGPLVQADGYDGHAVWNRDGSGLVWVDGGDVGRAESISMGFVDNYELWTPGRGGAQVAWGGPRSEANVDYEALVVTAPGSAAPFELWFDAKTHLPARFVQKLGPTTATRTYADYRPVAGLMVAHRTRTTDLLGNATDVTVVSAAQADASGAARLSKPRSDVHDFSIQGGKSQTRIPFKLIDNHVYLAVRLNGKGPYQFLLDTGGVNVVDPAVAKEIGADGQGDIQGGGAGADTQSFSLAKVQSLGVGEAVVKDQLFAVAPIRQGAGVASGLQIDGVIGFEVMSRFVTTFDYAHGAVVLAMPGRGPAPAGETVPFVFQGQQPQFACTIDNVPGNCTMDTGARDSVGFFGPFVAAHREVKPGTTTALGVDGFGFGGPSFGQLGRLTSFRVGSFTLPNLVADFTADTGGAMAQPFLAANIGGGVWRRFTLTLDYGRQTMTLKPNADFSAPDDYEHAGLFVIEREGKHFILDVRAGTPAADAGIVKGEVIDSVDGAPASTMSLQTIRLRFLEASGTKITLGLVGKDGARRTVVLTLRPFV